MFNIAGASISPVLFAIFYMDQPLRWNYLWASLCLMGAVYFIFEP